LPATLPVVRDPQGRDTAMTSRSLVSTFNVVDWTAQQLAERKGEHTISMCIPCRDEAATIGPIVAAVRRHVIEDWAVLDELIVLDDRSTDDTAIVAADAGATVVSIDDVHQRHGVGHGKGNALWASLVASHGDLVVWCDGDVTSFTPSWVVHLVAPLLIDDDLALVKAMYHRPTATGGGGRTTELVARPLLSLFAPELAALAQPLSGEFAARRTMIEHVGFVEGWGVEIAMLIDLAKLYGPASIAQVDLGERHHRHRSLDSLSVQAAEVMATALTRFAGTSFDAAPVLTRADGSIVPLNLAERPPLRAGSHP
jgi:glucosyl-3-phosphoglycerate synthase